jgi:hypothetical protein
MAPAETTCASSRVPALLPLSLPRQLALHGGSGLAPIGIEANESGGELGIKLSKSFHLNCNNPGGHSFGIDDCLECFHRRRQRVHAALRLDASLKGWHRGRVAI